MEILVTVLIFTIFAWLIGSWIRVPSRQLRISPMGGDNIPHLIAKLAKIEGSEKYKELTKEQQEKIDKIYEKLTDLSSLELTFIQMQNLVHVFTNSKSYFGSLDTGRIYLVNEKLGDINNDEFVELVISRKDSLLRGYLRISSESLSHDTKEKPDLLFEFPTQLLGNFVLNRGSLENKYELKKENVSDVSENEFNEYSGFSNVSWTQAQGKYFGYYFSTDK